jgi:hypothetical protein
MIKLLFRAILSHNGCSKKAQPGQMSVSFDVNQCTIAKVIGFKKPIESCGHLSRKIEDLSVLARGRAFEASAA